MQSTVVETSVTPTTDVAPTATTAPMRQPDSYDLVVVGDGLGGVAAAVTAGRRGHRVVVVSELGYSGGQAGSAAVTSFDDASGPARDLFRSSGIYAEFVATVSEYYAGLALDPSRCYFASVNTFCPEPHVVRRTLDTMLTDAGVAVIVDSVVALTRSDDGTITGVTTAAGRDIGGLVIDATEFGDLIPLAGADHDIGNAGTGSCVQDATHAVVMAWHPEVDPSIVVPEDAVDQVASAVGPDMVDLWLAEFRARVARGGQAVFTGWADLTFPIDPALADWYRGMTDSRLIDATDAPEITLSGVNLANDVPVSAAAVGGGVARDAMYRSATLKSYLYLWYSRWELGRHQWAVATHLGFESANRLVWIDEIPDAIERHMPPGYYVREARRLAGPTIEGSDIVERGIDVFENSGFLGGDRSDDDHGECATTDSTSNPRLGPYDAPLDLFLPSDVDGFLVGVARNGRVDRSVASSIRMHAPEMLGGQAVGMLAAIAIESGRDVADVTPESVRAALVAEGAIVDVP